MPEEFDEALEAARAEWATEHDVPPEYRGDLAAATTVLPGYRCVDLSDLSSHDLRLVDEILGKYRSKRRALSRYRRRQPLW